ncbi:MAG: TRAP transporter substrate-binding protein DctP [Paracoccaceae bacterium]
MKITAIAAATLAVLAAGPAASADQTLRVADSFPVGHYISESLLKPFMAEVAEKTGTEFEYFPAQQLGKAKDMLNIAQTGVADIAYVAPAYISDKLPIATVGELPEDYTSPCEGTAAFWEIAKPGGALDKAEFQPLGVRALMVLLLAPNQLFLSKELTGLDSFAGLKIRTSGGVKENLITKLGAVPVQMAAPEIRTSLDRGTIDGALLPHSSVPPYDLVPLLKSATEGVNLASFVVTYMISDAAWNKLSPEMQAVLTEAGENATREACKSIDRLDGEDKAKIAAGGVEFVSLSAEDAAKLKAMTLAVSDEWAAEQDGFGRPGAEILAAFRAALAK